MGFPWIARMPMRAVAWITCWVIISRGARPDEDEQGASLIETAASGHMVKSGYSRKASRSNLAMEMRDTRHEEQEEAGDGDGDGQQQAVAPAKEAIVIPKKGGHLGDGTVENSKLSKAFMEAKAKYEEAAKKVWGSDGTDMNDNFIQKQGEEWMKAVANFKMEAGNMREEAEKIYKAIVKSHTESAQKMMLTMKTEMSKMKKLNEYSKSMAEAVKTSGTNIKAHTEYYGKTVPGEETEPVNTKRSTEQAKTYSEGGDASVMDNTPPK